MKITPVPSGSSFFTARAVAPRSLRVRIMEAAARPLIVAEVYECPAFSIESVASPSCLITRSARSIAKNTTCWRRIDWICCCPQKFGKVGSWATCGFMRRSPDGDEGALGGPT